MNVYKKLLEVQTKLKAPKGQFNSFGKYNYRSCEDILESVKPILNESKATIIIKDTIKEIGGRIYVEATVIFIDIETGEKIETTALAREEENKKGIDSSQLTGSTSSYARKYALNGMFCIDDTKDSDSTNKHGKEDETKKENDNLSEKQIKRLYAIGNKAGITPKQIIAGAKRDYNIIQLEKLNKMQYDELCEKLEKAGGTK